MFNLDENTNLMDSKPGINWNYWIAQVIGWSLYGALLVFSTYASDQNGVTTELILNILIYLLLAIGLTHVMRFFILKSGWLNKKLVQLIPRIFLSSFVFSVVLTVLTNLIYFYTKSNDDFYEGVGPLKLLIQVLASTILILFWNALYFLYNIFIISKKQELHNLSILALKNEIELRSLRTQLNPHFLFNSLNAIRALIAIDPLKAKSAVTILSTLLRDSLVCSKLKVLSIKDEIDMVTNYLDLEKLRFEERLLVKWEVNSELMNFKIPPFSLQMLVENAVKHGISKLIDGGEVKISVFLKGNDLIIEVQNPGVLGRGKDLGIGIENIQRRLEIQYNEEAKFELLEIENRVISRISFKNVKEDNS